MGRRPIIHSAVNRATLISKLVTIAPKAHVKACLPWRQRLTLSPSVLRLLFIHFYGPLWLHVIIYCLKMCCESDIDRRKSVLLDLPILVHNSYMQVVRSYPHCDAAAWQLWRSVRHEYHAWTITFGFANLAK